VQVLVRMLLIVSRFPTTFSQLIAVVIVVSIGNQPNTHAPSNGIKLRPVIGINPVSYAKSQTDPA